MAATHFQECSEKIIKDSGCGLRRRTFNSFCHTGIIKNFWSFFILKRLVSGSFWQLSFSQGFLKFFCHALWKDEVKSISWVWPSAPSGWWVILSVICFIILDTISMISWDHNNLQRPWKTHRWWIKVKSSGTGIQFHKLGRCHCPPASYGRVLGQFFSVSSYPAYCGRWWKAWPQFLLRWHSSEEFHCLGIPTYPKNFLYMWSY